MNPRSRQNSWRHQSHNPHNAPPSPASRPNAGSGNPTTAGGVTARDRHARGTSAAAALPSAAAAVGTASVPSSPTFPKQQHQQEPQRGRQSYEGRYGGRRSCPTVVPSLTTGTESFVGPVFDVSGEAMAGRESASTSTGLYGGQHGARNFNDDDMDGEARGSEGRRLLFGARHR